MVEIQQADPAARKNAILWFLVVMGIGAPLIYMMEIYRADLIAGSGSDPQRAIDRLRLTINVFAAVFSVPLCLGGVYLWRVGTRMITAQRFPPPGMAVVRDTAVVTGAAACRRGYVIKAIAVALSALAIVIPMTLKLILESLQGS